MIRDILFWIAEGGWLLTLIIYFLHIKYIQRQYLGQVNKELEYLIKLRYEVIRIIDSYNSRHRDKIILEDVEPINMDEL